MAVIFQDFVDLYTWDPVQGQWTINGLNIDNLSTEELEALAEYVRGYSLTTPQGQALIGSAYTTVGGAPASQIGSGTALDLAQSAPLDASAEELLSMGQGAMETGAGTGVYKTASLLSLDLGAVGAAVSPILGVALGAELYSANPQFWTLLSQKLLPFCYPGTTKIPAWMDIVESALHPGTYEQNVVIDKRIIQAIQEFYKEQGIISDIEEHEGSVRIGSYTLIGPLYRFYIGPNATVVIATGNRYGGVTTLYNSNNFGLYFGYIQDTNSIFVTGVNNQDGSYVSIGALDEDGIARAVTSIPRFTHNNDGAGVSRNYGEMTNYSTELYGSLVIGGSVLGGTNVIYKASLATYFQVGEFVPEGEIPPGASSWQGQPGSIVDYTAPVVYMEEDPENPGQFVPVSYPGVAIAVPPYQEQPATATEELTKPDNWPEGEPWPTTIPFPWPAPEGYVGEWPETMPWPLPLQQPDWWPEGLSYPTLTTNNPASIDPVANPNPNQNADPAIPVPHLVTSVPGQAVSPAVQTVPQPVLDPTTVMQPINPVTTITDIMDPAIPVPEGVTPLPVVPTIPLPFSSGNDGLISVYHPTDAQLKAFASWLWVTYADPSIDKLWNNPFDGVIGLMEIYCTPTDVGAKTIRSGFLDSGVSSQTISRYTSIDCGSITVPEYYGNYLDYSPYSKCHVYLPFIGIVELNVDDIVGHAVNITYVIDEYNGSCIAQITVARSIEVGGEDVDYSNLMYQFSGNCAVELPLAGGSQAAIRAGLIQAAAYGLSSVIGGVVSGVSGNIGGAISQIGYGAANAIGSVVSAKSSVQHSGSFGSSFGAMGVKTPYIIVSRPKQINVVDYNKLYGYPAHAAVTVGSCTGYLRVREVNVASSTASDEEKKRIEELLKEGIYIE